MTNRTIRIQDLGVIEYQPAWDYQEQLLQENVRIKQAKGRGEIPADGAVTTNHFLFCEHPPVYTLGKKTCCSTKSSWQTRALPSYLPTGGAILPTTARGR